jgi:hypothetical protein
LIENKVLPSNNDFVFPQYFTILSSHLYQYDFSSNDLRHFFDLGFRAGVAITDGAGRPRLRRKRIVDPHDGCAGDGIIDRPNPGGHGGFKFENPLTNCKYVSQPYIYDNFMEFQTNLGQMFTLAHKDVDFTIVGYQPVAGHYDNVIRLFVNAIRRVSGCLTDHMDKFGVHILGIHGACDSDWSVQEVQFTGVMNPGTF